MRRRLPAALPVTVATVAALVLTACGSDADGGASNPPSTPSMPATTDSATQSSSQTSSATESSASESIGSGSAAEPVAVNKTITDPQLGNRYQVLKYIDGYQASATSKERYSTVKDGKVVLVQVRVTAGTKYSGLAGAGDFRLTKTPNDIDVSPTTILDSDVTASGHPPLEDADGGETKTGWLVFVVDKDLTKLVLRVKRLAYKILGGGGNIPEKTWDLPLN